MENWRGSAGRLLQSNLRSLCLSTPARRRSAKSGSRLRILNASSVHLLYRHLKLITGRALSQYVPRVIGIRLQFSPELLDDDADILNLSGAIPLPHRLREILWSKWTISMSYQMTQYQALFRSKMCYPSVRAFDLVRLKIYCAVLQHNKLRSCAGRRHAAQDGAHACQQLSEYKAVGNIVISASIQRIDAALTAIVPGEQNDSQIRLRADGAAQLKRLNRIERAVQNKNIVDTGGCLLDRFAGGLRLDNHIPFEFKGDAQFSAHLGAANRHKNSARFHRAPPEKDQARTSP